jgi:DNA-binding MarR family transcriptional regulator
MKLEQEIAQRKFRNERHKVAVNILYTYGWLIALHTQVFKQHGITSQQFNVLRILRGQNPNPTSIKLIKNRMLDKMSDASRIVEKLRQKGLVKRNTNNSDRRHVDVFITRKGLKVLADLDKRDKEFDNHSARLTAKETEQLNMLLDKLRG